VAGIQGTDCTYAAARIRAYGVTRERRQYFVHLSLVQALCTTLKLKIK